MRAFHYFHRHPYTMQVALMFGVSLSVRLLYSFGVAGPTLGTDTALYYAHTESLLTTMTFGIPNRPPGTPFVWAVIIGLVDHYPNSIVFFQAILSAFVVPLTLGIGRALFSRQVGLIAGWLAVFYFPFIDFTRMVQSDIQFLFLVTLAAFILANGRSKFMLFLGGMMIGFAALTRTIGLAYFPFIVLLGLTGLRPKGWEAVKIRLEHLALICIGAAIVVSPWTLRNWVHYHAFVPVSSEGGLNLFLGAQESFLTERQWDRDLARELTGWESDDELDLWHPSYQDELTNYWIQLWRTDPSLHLRLRALSFFDFWSPVERIRFYTPGPGTFYKAILYTLLLPFFVIGGFLTVRDKVPGTYFMLAAILGTVLLHTITKAEQDRYRMPIEPFYLVLAAQGFLVVWRTISSRRSPA